MNTVLPGIDRQNVNKKSSNKKKIIRIAVIGLIVILAIAAVVIFITQRNSKSALSSQQHTAQVTKGNISVSITGSAPVESANRRTVSPKATATVKKIYFKAGDQVKTGDVMFELDDTDAQLAIEDTKNNIAQNVLSQNSTSKSVTGLSVKADFSGQVTGIKAKVGDTIGKGSPIATLTDTTKLKVTLPFNGAGISGITVGKKAVVYLQDLMQSVSGTVTYVSKKPYTSSSGGQLYNVDISIPNPGSIKEGMKANAEISVSGGTAASVESSTLSYINMTELRSDAGGTITSLNLFENQYADAGEVLAVLQNDDLKLNAGTTDLKLQSLNRQLQIKQDQLSYYKILAPCDGTIISQSVIEGDTVKIGDSLAVVSDMGHLQFSVSIDELDISKIQIGQTVKITADALSETSTKPLAGKVSEIAMEGASSNGVTTYPVTVTINDMGKLKTGMNVNAEIMISDKSDILMVPLEAIQTFNGKSFVYVKGAASQNGNAQQNGFRAQSGNTKQGGNTTQGSISAARGNGRNSGSTTRSAITAQGNQQQGNASSTQSNSTGSSRTRTVDTYYANAHMVQVETGINNDSFIEITSGLSDGEEIILPKINTSSTKSTSTSSSSGSSRSGNSTGAMMRAAGGGANGPMD